MRLEAPSGTDAPALQIAPQATVKDAIKEGGKKGQDLNGVAAMGGVTYFNVAVETPEGDMDLLEHVLEGANTEVDEVCACKMIMLVSGCLA